MLIQEFYRTENLNHIEGKISCSIVLNQAHEVYTGHFPGQPVVPGVIQLQIIKEILEKSLRQQLFLKQISLAKYLQPIEPTLFPVLEIKIEYNLTEENMYKINALLLAKEITFSKIRALVDLKVKGQP
jgi:3-hydroxyacyl-[acyl-carrier-protein] dehydratase